MINKGIGALVLAVVVAGNTSCRGPLESKDIYHGQGQMAGEVTETTVILQSRLTASDQLIDGDVAGVKGWGQFEVAENGDFSGSFKTAWVEAASENDFIIKEKVTGLEAGREYYYRLIYGADKRDVKAGEACRFKTLGGAGSAEDVDFVVTACMSYARFHVGGGLVPAYTGADKGLGYPALETILKLRPDFFVGTGDTVYYDHPEATPARTQGELRRKWHEQFVQPRCRGLFGQVATYWEKDDHDWRYDDADNTLGREPSPELGSRMFLEQLPVIGPGDKGAVTYRTHRVSSDLQIWLVEGRDYRSPNKMADGPGKSIWGDEQKDWLKRTLLESDATFKLLISPTPMVGPDDMSKRDNHTNPQGFRYEGERFFEWLAENGFLDKGFYIVCGDRHWQYHSVHPTGFEEFSCGTLVTGNSRMGRKPGERGSTDPAGQVMQPWIYSEASGGFLRIRVSGGKEGKPAITFSFYNRDGEMPYECRKER